MKFILIIYYICTIVLFAILIYCVYDFTKPYTTNFEKGQVWVYEYQPDNPFNNATIDTNVIIDVKGDYIMYKNSWEDSAVQSKRYFLIGSRLIKPLR